MDVLENGIVQSFVAITLHRNVKPSVSPLGRREFQFHQNHVEAVPTHMQAMTKQLRSNGSARDSGQLERREKRDSGKSLLSCLVSSPVESARRGVLLGHQLCVSRRSSARYNSELHRPPVTSSIDE
ncbi:hypothetical protein MHYP_G00146530 [Metynnis hypsauchen]